MSLYKLHERQKSLLDQIRSYHKFICKGKDIEANKHELLKYKKLVESKILKGKTEAEIIAKFQNKLSDLINKAGVSIERMEEARIKEEKDAKIIQTRLYITGDSNKILKVLYLIESNPSPKFIIKNLTLRKRTYFGKKGTKIQMYITVAAPVELK